MTKQEALDKIERLLKTTVDQGFLQGRFLMDGTFNKKTKNKINKEWDKQKYEQAVYEIDTAEIEKKVLKHHGITYE